MIYYNKVNLFLKSNAIINCFFYSHLTYILWMLLNFLYIYDGYVIFENIFAIKVNECNMQNSHMF